MPRVRLHVDYDSLRIQPPLRATAACRVRRGENTASGWSAERRLYLQAKIMMALTKANFENIYIIKV